jgi:hypothetical protein
MLLLIGNERNLSLKAGMFSDGRDSQLDSIDNAAMITR